MTGFQQREGVGAEEIAHLHRHPFGRRWRVRQRQAIERQQDGAGRRYVEDGDAGRHASHADKDPGHNPANGAEHANYREGLIDVRQAVEGNVVGQCQGRHVAERVAKKQADQQRTVFRN